MELVSVIIAAVATIVSVAAALRGRQLSRARVALHLGTVALDPASSKVARRHPKRFIVYGVPDVPRDYLVLPLVIGLENRTSLPVTSIHVQVEYAAESLLDGSRIQDERHGALTVNQISMAGRKAARFGAVAQVNFESEMLRAKEKRVLFELVRIPRGCVSGAADDAQAMTLQRRWAGVAGFAGAIQVRISLWAANCDPIAIRGMVAACAAHDEVLLTRRSQELVARLWDGYRPTGRRLRRVFPLRNSWRLEAAELILLSADALDADKTQVDPFVLRNSPHALLRFALPPWEFTGAAFDAPGTKSSNRNVAGA